MGVLLWSVPCPGVGMLGGAMSGSPGKGTDGKGNQDLNPSLVHSLGKHPLPHAAVTLTQLIPL